MPHAMSHAAPLRTFAVLTFAVCLIVVVLGSYVRLSDAGLGCPDWPGCYGHMSPLGAQADTGPDGSAAAVASSSGRPLEPGKAWREMLHRYAAGTLAVMIFILALLAFSWRRERLMTPALSLTLPALVLVQAIFGMLTVTWRLKPIIVTTHLLLGLTTLSLLWWLVLGLTRVKRAPRFAGGLPEIDLPGPRVRRARGFAALGLVVLVVQIVLGGWTSSNYAALACPDLPTCQNAWWPAADFQDGFSPGRDVTINETRGLGSLALVAIQLTHRIGALVLSLTLLFAGIAALRAHAGGAASLAASCVIAALGLQLTIGISMVLMGFPLALATAHNAGAALLLLATLALNRTLQPVPT
jgi:cytochrome c oxidase assembly protein subunit 15